MNGFEEEAPSNLGTGTPETNPLALIFSEHYSFGAPIYNIENNPGSAAPSPGIPTEAPTEFPPAEQEPTPAALVPGNPGADEAWFVWTGISPIQISIPSGADVRSIYISGNLSGQTIYITSGYTAGGFMTVSPGYSKDMIPIPPGSPLLTLYVANFSPTGFDEPIYVCAYGGVWNPFNTGGGLGTLVWLNDDTLGSGEVFTNTLSTKMLVTVGGTSAQAYINGVAVSGGQPGTYLLNPGDEIYFIYGYDVTVLSMSNLTHYYPMEFFNPTNSTTPDLVTGGAPGAFTTLEVGHYEQPFVNSAYPITADGAPCIEMNIDNSGSHDNYGWQFVAGTGQSGAWSMVFWFRDCGQYLKNVNASEAMLLQIRPTITDPTMCIFCTYAPPLDYNLPTNPMQSYVLTDRVTENFTLPVPSYFSNYTYPDYADYPSHMVTITWDGVDQLSVGFDNNTPTVGTFTETGTPSFYQPSIGGDNNGQFCAHIQLAKVAIFNTKIASAITQELYEQGTVGVTPVFQFFQILGTS